MKLTEIFGELDRQEENRKKPEAIELWNQIQTNKMYSSAATETYLKTGRQSALRSVFTHNSAAARKQEILDRIVKT